MSALPAIRALAGRTVRHVARQPAAIAFSFVLPLLLLALTVGALRTASALPGFPARSFLDFAAAGTFLQGALFAAVTVGSGIARDLETGFVRRLLLAPGRNVGVAVGYTTGAAAVGGIQGVAFIAVILAAGTHIATGMPGAAAIIGCAILANLAMATWATLLAILARSEETVLECFPLMLFALYASSALLPRPLIKASWFRAIADYNPFSYLIEGIRQLFLGGWSAGTILAGIAAAIGLTAVAAATAAVVLARRKGASV